MSEVITKTGKITIRPYCDKTKSNMGLEKYGYVVFPGTHQEEEMACVEENGKVRYLNGLNEHAPEIKKIADEDVKKAKIKEIRTIVAKLEEEKNFNKVDIKDPEFWNKIEMFRPDNKDLWSKIKVRCDNKSIILNPDTSLDDLLTVKAIEAGGFPLIARSLEEVKSGKETKKWYLDREVETVGRKVSTGQVKNKALALLQKLSEKEPRKLFYAAKMIATNSAQYTNSTIQEIIYDDMDSFISGEGYERSIEKSAKLFMTYGMMPLEELKIKCIIRDAVFYKMIILKADGLLYTNPKNILLGRTQADVYEFLISPLNADVLSEMLENVEKNW